MASTANSNNCLARQESTLSSVPSEILQEQAISRNGQSQLASNAYQRMIEQKEQELRESIMANYNHIREVEKELSGLSIQLQVNVGPRKHALELLRARIEKQNVHVSKVRAKYNAAKQAFLALEAELETEEAKKEQLCNELSLLVQESATAQLAKLEELKQHLDQLATRRAGATAVSSAHTTSNVEAENGQASSHIQLPSSRAGIHKAQELHNVVAVEASSAARRSHNTYNGGHTMSGASSEPGNQPAQPVSEQQKLLAEVAAARTRKAQQMDRHTISIQQDLETRSTARQAVTTGNVMIGNGQRHPVGGLAQGGKFSGFDV